MDTNQGVEPLHVEKITHLSAGSSSINSAHSSDSYKTATGSTLLSGRQNLKKWLGKPFRVVLTDGRVLMGIFSCTDKDVNLVLAKCVEYLDESKSPNHLGFVVIPGKHIASIAVNEPPECALLN